MLMFKVHALRAAALFVYLTCLFVMSLCTVVLFIVLDIQYWHLLPSLDQWSRVWTGPGIFGAAAGLAMVMDRFGGWVYRELVFKSASAPKEEEEDKC